MSHKAMHDREEKEAELGDTAEGETLDQINEAVPFCCCCCFDGSAPAPGLDPNRFAPKDDDGWNDGSPVGVFPSAPGCEPMNDGAFPSPPDTPPLPAEGSANMVALNGFPVPAIPVACGLRPEPTPPPPNPPNAPVCCAPFGCGCGDSLGDCGIGGRDSRSAAPNEEDGLKGLMPAKPVVCGMSEPDGIGTLSDGAPDVLNVLESALAPVGWLESEEKRVSEKIEVEVPVGELGCAEEPNPPVDPLGLLKENEEATLAMVDWPAGELKALKPVACGAKPEDDCCCCCC